MKVQIPRGHRNGGQLEGHDVVIIYLNNVSCKSGHTANKSLKVCQFIKLKAFQFILKWLKMGKKMS